MRAIFAWKKNDVAALNLAHALHAEIDICHHRSWSALRRATAPAARRARPRTAPVRTHLPPPALAAATSAFTSNVPAVDGIAELSYFMLQFAY